MTTTCPRLEWHTQRDPFVPAAAWLHTGPVDGPGVRLFEVRRNDAAEEPERFELHVDVGWNGLRHGLLSAHPSAAAAKAAGGAVVAGWGRA